MTLVMRRHSLLLFVEGLLAILVIVLDPRIETSWLPIPVLYPLVLYSYGMHGGLSTFIALHLQRHERGRWGAVLALHLVSLALMGGLSIGVFWAWLYALV
jgi:hypothetical protein